MQVGQPIESLAAALHAACLRDLPTIEYQDRDWDAYREYMSRLTADGKRQQYEQERLSGSCVGPTVAKTRRPTPDQCEVIMFPQTWGSTALGYCGVGGSAMTSAYTTVIRCRVTGASAIYFGNGGRAAYVVTSDNRSADFLAALGAHNMPGVREAVAAGWTAVMEQEVSP
ncbi:MAG: hypothetical protein ACREPQ_14330 [Rhodanobacter sp.]